ncbi:VWA domain-containing protein [Pelagovum pacificum]|nr:VWA domain-containing protein [Pelagovum pacificum]QQA44487.1 VWA domain-containing protein [Pelagovum pacificum]
MRALLVALLVCLLPLGAVAQTRPNTILVMDGSGSMWGQIEGVNKIVIAREVVSEILSDFPEDQNLGLTVYGHRTRGDCSDIETVVAPDIGTASTIVDVVNGINPRGKTPMTDAIIAAAEALRYTEEKATVVLVSDGIETCNPDPCAAARLLEQSGIDFTAHVIGFDVGNEPDAIEQMQCIADETGGTFTTASNASELTDALSVVVEPEPVSAPVTFTAELTDGTLITDPVLWDVTDGTTAFADDEGGNPLEMVMEEGSYTATAYWTVTETEMQTTFEIVDSAPVDVTLVFEMPLPAASLMAPETAVGGSTVMVEWDGPNEGLDNIQVAPLDGSYYDYSYTERGNPVGLVMPPRAGTFELRYVLRDRETIATRLITLTEPEIGLEAPASVVAGSSFDVGWTGPDQGGDNVQIGPAEGGYSDYSYTRNGNPVSIVAPSAPGTYELRYRFRDRETIYTQPIEVTEVGALLTAPESAVAGSTIQVGWDGPDYANDYIGVSEPAEDGYVNYTYTRDGNPVDLVMPTEAGTYELRYYLNEDRTILARKAIEVTPIEATLEAPETAAAGETVQVTWTGPDYANDYIGVSVPTEDGYENYTYTRDGSPLGLVMPTEAGTYEIRYYLSQGSRVIGSTTIEVTEVAAALTAPDTAVAGSTIQVGWDGPDYANDYIGVSTPGEDGYINYSYTRDGNPVDLVLPAEPGSYELRYFMSQDQRVIATRPIEVSDTGAMLTLPETAKAGETIDVVWEGPDYPNDYIGIYEVGETGASINYTRTSQGSPLALQMPAEAGTYEVRYVIQQTRRTLASATIEVTDTEASLVLPETAPVGSTIQVGWDGPDYPNDFIAVYEVGATGASINYTRTSAGNPLELLMPTETGTYEVRYVMDQDRRVLASTTIELTKIGVTVTAPETAPLGSTVTVEWDGPDYPNDYIGVYEVGATGGSLNYTRTSQGNPLELLMPATEGTYEIRYMLDQDRQVAASTQITLTPVAVALTAPDTAAAGATIQIGWDGPDYPNDYIGVYDVGATGGSINYTRTSAGNPLNLLLPPTPGEFEIRYMIDQDRTVMATHLITTTPLKAELSAETSVPQGATIPVTWEGPDYPNDFIGVYEVGATGGSINYARTSAGNPAQLLMPAQPGTYEIRYMVEQDRTQLKSLTVEVTPLDVQIVAPPSGAAGSELPVGWDGPDYPSDYIGLYEVGATGGSLSYTRTSQGNPVMIRLPDEPGDYELRYMLDQDRTMLATIPVTVE